jgi:phenylalanyl-tRNA synthetase alpha chain
MPAEPAEERNDIMKEQLEAIRAAAKKALSDCADSKVLETLRVQYLGKKGELTGILKQMGKLSAEERPAMGQLANQVRADIETALADKQKKLAEAMLAHKLEAETLDITLPGKKQKVGSMHPLTIVENEIREIFLGMGFSVADGPEVEYDYYNFEALNLPPDHPARYLLYYR